VLVQRYTSSTGAVSGHVTPVAYSMVNNTTGRQALMVTYDPLAAAAAVFIDQYQAHVTACLATSSEAITELNQQAGTKLWACSNATAKVDYLSGMTQLLAGAKSYLFGRADGSAPVSCAGTTTTGACTSADAHFPYNFVVPDYTEASFNPEYFARLDTALASYRAMLAAGTASSLHRALQFAGVSKFETNASALVTTRVKRSGAYGATCAEK
jgi:hypothetical protein